MYIFSDVELELTFVLRSTDSVVVIRGNDIAVRLLEADKWKFDGVFLFYVRGNDIWANDILDLT